MNGGGYDDLGDLGDLPPASEESAFLPSIVVRPAVHETVAEAVEALTRRACVTGRLWLFGDDGVLSELHPGPPGVSMRPIGVNRLRTEATSAGQWAREDAKNDGIYIPCAPPADFLASILEVPPHEWPEAMPRAARLQPAPTIGANGVPITRPGPADGWLGVWDEAFGAEVAIAAEEFREDTAAAVALIDDLFRDFPFADGSRASAVAAILTNVGRAGIAGDVPLFLVDSPTPGSGKGLMVEVCTWIAEGRGPSLFTTGGNEEEFEKRIGASLLDGSASTVMLDEVGHQGEKRGGQTFGGSALQGMLTSWVSGYSLRPLGQSKIRKLRLCVTWWACGNNVRIYPDMRRRTLPIRIEPLEERPEDRAGLRDLAAYARENRARLLGACLGLLWRFRLDVEMGEAQWGPDQLGSFRAWSRLIRGCVSFFWGQDPWMANRFLADASAADDRMLELGEAWWAALGPRSVALRGLAEDVDAAAATTQTAFDAFANDEGARLVALGKVLRLYWPDRSPGGWDVRAVGSSLKAYTGRTINGRQWRKDDRSRSNKGTLWRMIETKKEEA